MASLLYQMAEAKKEKDTIKDPHRPLRPFEHYTAVASNLTNKDPPSRPLSNIGFEEGVAIQLTRSQIPREIRRETLTDVDNQSCNFHCKYPIKLYFKESTYFGACLSRLHEKWPFLLTFDYFKIHLESGDFICKDEPTYNCICFYRVDQYFTREDGSKLSLWTSSNLIQN